MNFSILSVAHIKWQKLLLWYDINDVITVLLEHDSKFQ